MIPRWSCLLLLLATSAHAGEGTPAWKPRLDVRRPVPRAIHATTEESVFGSVPIERITLQQAIERALQNNLEAKFDQVGIRVEHARMRFEAGAFDPAFSINTSQESTRRLENINDIRSSDVLRQEQQITAINRQAEANQALATAIAQQNGTPLPPDLTPISRSNVTGGISSTAFDQQTNRNSSSFIQRTPWGMRYGFFAEANRLRNTFSGDAREIIPEYQTSVQLQVVQPLLKDFGTNANLTNLRVARINERIAVMTWRQRVTTTVQAVIATYYDMLFAMADIGVQQDAIAADKNLATQNERRLEIGFMSPFDVQQARAQVSRDEERLLTSKNVFMERQFALKRLIIEEFKRDDARVFLPVSAVSLPIPALNRTALVGEAFENRYDYHQALAEAEAQELRLKFARNQLLPQLDLVATYGVNGLGASYDESIDQAFAGRTPAWSVGVNVRVPFGFVQGRAQLDAAKAQKEQAILRIKQTELTVSVDVDTVISRIETNRGRVEAAQKTRMLNEEAVRIVYKRLDEGQASSFDVIEQQRLLYDARSRELASIAELNKSVSQLWLVTGTILQRNGIGFR